MCVVAGESVCVCVTPENKKNGGKNLHLHHCDERLPWVGESHRGNAVVSVHDGVDKRVKDHEDPHTLILQVDAQVDIPRRAKMVEPLQEGDRFPLRRIEEIVLSN